MPKKKLKVEIICENDDFMPSYSYEDAAGMDLYAAENARVPGGGVKAVSVGIKLSMPKGYYATIEERSGVSLKTSLILKAGIIDSDYRGTIKAIFTNNNFKFYDIVKGDKIAQLIFHKKENATLEPVSVFSGEGTLRGEKGFGSTDK